MSPVILGDMSSLSPLILASATFDFAHRDSVRWPKEIRIYMNRKCTGATAKRGALDVVIARYSPTSHGKERR
jgi:hypothetical protein